MEFRKITFDNYDACRKLSPGKMNEDFVAPNVNSLAAAYVALESNACKPMPFGIYKDDILVGFIMMAYITTEQDKTLETPIYEVWRFMVDEKYQGKGYGKEALLKAIEHMKTKPHGPSDSCFLSYVPGNEKAEGLYTDVGFAATGVIEDGEVQMKLAL